MQILKCFDHILRMNSQKNRIIFCMVVMQSLLIYISFLFRNISNCKKLFLQTVSFNLLSLILYEKLRNILGSLRLLNSSMLFVLSQSPLLTNFISLSTSHSVNSIRMHLVANVLFVYLGRVLNF